MALLVRPISALDLLVLLICVYLGRLLILVRHQKTKTSRLSGPSRNNWLFGAQRYLSNSDDVGLEFAKWAAEYGPVYEIPTALGYSRIILTDPKAIAHFCARDTFTYIRGKHMKRMIDLLLGRGLIWADGESHRRQRKAVSSAFSNAAIRKVTSVFFDSAYKVKEVWDTTIDSSSSDEAIIDVQHWMNCVSLDSIGIAGFGHNFGTLQGKRSVVAEVFDAFNDLKPSILEIVNFLLGPRIPFLSKLPTERTKLTKRWNESVAEIAEEMLARTKQTYGEDSKTEEKSIIGLLLKAENADTDLYISPEEVMAQMKVLIFAGYETTSISLTWALIELCKHPEAQTKLREELTSQFGASDPTWDQLMTELPYLDGVVHEILRLHAPVEEAIREATEDDVIPLSTPITDTSGITIDRITVAKGTQVSVPITCMNYLESLWGPDVSEFKPERWMNGVEGLPHKVQEVQGYRHLLSFMDGPRICLGRGFALAEFKAVLSVLIRNYTFEFADSTNTEIEKVRAMLPRPRLAGEKGIRVPLRVRRTH